MMYKTIFKCRYILAVVVFCALGQVRAQKTSFQPGKMWFDNNQRLINAHGGGVLYHAGKYYWFGEHKGEQSNAAWVGVSCYSSADLYNWEDEGVALAVSKDEESANVEGGSIERPNVTYNEETEQFGVSFHLELEGRGYEAADVAIAPSHNPAGP